MALSIRLIDKNPFIYKVWSPVLITLTLAVVLKALCEVAALAILGQFILGLLAGAKRDTNFFYQILQIMTKPVYGLARLITPKVVIDRHIPLAALALLAVAWVALTMMKIQACVDVGMAACK